MSPLISKLPRMSECMAMAPVAGEEAEIGKQSLVIVRRSNQKLSNTQAMEIRILIIVLSFKIQLNHNKSLFAINNSPFASIHDR